MYATNIIQGEGLLKHIKLTNKNKNLYTVSLETEDDLELFSDTTSNEEYFIVFDKPFDIKFCEKIILKITSETEINITTDYMINYDYYCHSCTYETFMINFDTKITIRCKDGKLGIDKKRCRHCKQIL